MVATDDDLSALLEALLVKREPGATVYAIDSSYFARVKRFCEGKDSTRPGPVDNSQLVDSEESTPRVARFKSVVDFHFAALSKTAWDLMVQTFGKSENCVELPMPVLPNGNVEALPMKVLVDNDAYDGFKEIHVSRLATLDDLKVLVRNQVAGDMVLGEHIRLMPMVGVVLQPALTGGDKTLFELGVINEARLRVESGSADVGGAAEDEDTDMADMGTDVEVSQPVMNYGSPVSPIINFPQIGSAKRRSLESDDRGSASKIRSSLMDGGYGRSYGYGYGSSYSFASATPGMCGLRNIGNTCFMNSSLQCISNIQQLTSYFLENGQAEEINRDSPIGCKGELAEEFADLMKQMWSGDNRSYSPSSLKDVVGKYAPRFQGYEQHDSQEFLEFLLDGLHEDLNRVRERPQVEAIEGKGMADDEASSLSWEAHKKRNDSVIVDTFQGQYKSTLRCPKCKDISIKFDPFMTLTLPIPNKERQMCDVQVVMPTGKRRKYGVLVPKGRALVRDARRGLAELLDVPSEGLVMWLFKNKSYSQSYRPQSQVAEEEIQQLKDTAPLTKYGSGELIAVVVDPGTTVMPLFVRYELSQWSRRHGPFFARFPADSGEAVGQGVVHDAVNRAISHWIDPRVCRSLQPRRPSGPSPLAAASADEAPAKLDGPLSGTLPGTRVVYRAGESQIDCLKLEPTDLVPVPTGTITLQFENEHCAKSSLKVYEIDLFEKDPSLAKRYDEIDASCDLYECFDMFSSEEELGEDNMWYCPTCKEQVQAHKKMELFKLPDVLIVHLKRFSHNRWHRQKLNVPVDYPLDGLELSKYLHGSATADAPTSYSLVGVSLHSGVMSGGHYTALCQNFQNSQWYSFDDSFVMEKSKDRAKSDSGYVLFYQRNK